MVNERRRKAPTKSVAIPARRITSVSEIPLDVIYTRDGTLAPRLPMDPDLPVLKVREGLAPKPDLMARLMARGIGPSDAYRAAYGETEGRSATDTAINAAKIIDRHGLRQLASEYREEMKVWQEQHALPVRDYVLGRLTHESQTAQNDGARIKALELLGKSQAMWTTVHKVERSINKQDIQTLKAQLEQRFRTALSRTFHNSNYTDVDSAKEEGGMGAVENGTGEPHRGTAPLVRDGTPAAPSIVIHSRTPQNVGPPLSVEGPVSDPTPGGVSSNIMSQSHRDESNIVACDEGEFSGPLVLKSL